MQDTSCFSFSEDSNPLRAHKPHFFVGGRRGRCGPFRYPGLHNAREVNVGERLGISLFGMFESLHSLTFRIRQPPPPPLRNKTMSSLFFTAPLAISGSERLEAHRQDALHAQERGRVRTSVSPPRAPLRRQGEIRPCAGKSSFGPVLL